MQPRTADYLEPLGRELRGLLVVSDALNEAEYLGVTHAPFLEYLLDLLVVQFVFRSLQDGRVVLLCLDVRFDETGQ